MKLLFIFGNVEYNRKLKASKHEYKLSLRQEEGTREARKVQSACSSSNITNKNKTKTKQGPTRQRLDNQKKKTNSIYLIIIPINKEMRSTRIQTAHLAGHFYKLTLWLLYADMYTFMAPVIKTCLYLLSERACSGGFF